MLTELQQQVFNNVKSIISRDKLTASCWLRKDLYNRNKQTLRQLIQLELIEVTQSGNDFYFKLKK